MSELAKLVLKKRRITASQADILRYAARKFTDYYGHSQALHDGTVNTFGKLQSSIHALVAEGLIQKEFVQAVEAERERIKAHAESIIVTAIANAARNFKEGDVFEIDAGGKPHWQRLLFSLGTAEAGLKSLNATCLRITAFGRIVAAEWKAAIKAAEE